MFSPFCSNCWAAFIAKCICATYHKCFWKPKDIMLSKLHDKTEDAKGAWGIKYCTLCDKASPYIEANGGIEVK